MMRFFYWPHFISDIDVCLCFMFLPFVIFNLLLGFKYPLIFSGPNYPGPHTLVKDCVLELRMPSLVAIEGRVFFWKGKEKK